MKKKNQKHNIENDKMFAQEIERKKLLNCE